MTEKSVKEGTAKLVIVADDASDNTKKEFRDMCTYYKVPYYEYSSKEELGRSMGKEMRASLSITDSGFAISGVEMVSRMPTMFCPTCRQIVC